MLILIQKYNNLFVLVPLSLVAEYNATKAQSIFKEKA